MTLHLISIADAPPSTAASEKQENGNMGMLSGFDVRMVLMHLDFASRMTIRGGELRSPAHCAAADDYIRKVRDMILKASVGDVEVAGAASLPADVAQALAEGGA